MPSRSARRGSIELAKPKQQTGKTVLEKRRLKKAKREAAAVARRKSQRAS